MAKSRKYAVYLIIVNNGKEYVGYSYQPEKRLEAHWKARKYAIGPALRKHGIRSFNILSWWDTKAEAGNEEERLIELRGTLTPGGYNLTTGKDGGDTYSGLTPEQQADRSEKISQAWADKSDEQVAQEAETKSQALLANRGYELVSLEAAQEADAEAVAAGEPAFWVDCFRAIDLNKTLLMKR